MFGTQEKSTALVLFTRSAHDEARAKDFSDVHSLPTNERIAGELISHAEHIAKGCGLPYFIISSDQQTGNTFGQKLSNAFSAIYELGYINVIAIGNDCPELTSNDIILSAAQLKNNDAVLGPDTNGGLYLIGLNKKYFDTGLFEQQPWGTDHVADTLQQYLSELAASVYLHTVKADVDSHSDMLEVLKKHFTATYLKFRIRSILASVRNYFEVIHYIFITTGQHNFSSLRAPPAL